MKKLLLVLIASFFLISSIYNSGWAQGYKNKIELSVAGSLQSHVSNGESVQFLNIPLRVGFFFTPGLELEAEGIITAIDADFTFSGDTEVGYILSGNLSYNVKATPLLTPFALAGYGISNTEPIVNTALLGDADITLGVLNLGFGAKIGVGSKSAVRVEYRFQNFTGEQDTFFGPQDIDFQIHTFQFGVSLFLP